jgi:hypothetical protein
MGRQLPSPIFEKREKARFGASSLAEPRPMALATWGRRRDECRRARDHALPPALGWVLEPANRKVGFWHDSDVEGWAEHVRSAQVFQTSTCSAIARASTTSMPR